MFRNYLDHLQVGDKEYLFTRMQQLSLLGVITAVEGEFSD